MNVERDNAAVCACCGRPAEGVGYALKHSKKILWVCNDPECLEIAKATHAMKQQEFSLLEGRAVSVGGEEAGAYLDQIGKTDLVKLSPEQWFEFCRRMVAGYRSELKRDMLEAKKRYLKDKVPF